MIDDDPRIDPADLRGVRFPGSRRRYEAAAVDQFLESLVDRISATNALVDDLQRRLDDALAAGTEATVDPSPAGSPFDPPDLSGLSDDALVGLVGAETAHVLSTARRAAEEIRSKAEESASRVIREATTEARQTADDAESRAAALLSEAESARAEAEADAVKATTELRAKAEQEVETVLAGARQQAEETREAAEATRTAAEADAQRIRDEAREEGRSMVNEAKAVRTRVLEDLQRRRSAARSQIETLLAGRERLLAAYERVRTDLDLATAELEAAGPDLHDHEHDDAADDELIASLGADEPDRPDEPDQPVLADPGDGGAGDGAEVDDADATDDAGATDEAHDGVPAAGDVAADEVPADEVAADEVPADEAAADTDQTVAVDPARPTEADPEPELADELVDEVDEVDEVEASGESEPVAQAVEPAVAEPAADETRADERDADEPHADEPDADEPVADEPRDVDALFARIRAERAESVARAQRVLSGGAAGPAATAPTEADPSPTVDAEPEPEPEPDTEAAAAEIDEAPAPTDDASTGQTTADGDGDGDVDVDAVPADLLAGGPMLDQRAEVIDRLDSKLSRALKRHLADEQNEVLDGLRRSQSTAVDGLLPDASDHVSGYAEVARTVLEEAAAAGAAGAGATPDIGPLAQQLGAALVEPFRRRIERAADEVDGDPDELDDRLRAVYREWKVTRIGDATTDALLSAHALGQLASAPAGASVRWLIDPAQGPCPDAQDNALAGALPAGDAFPTGDVCPQAHPGCRCMLVVDA